MKVKDFSALLRAAQQLYANSGSHSAALLNALEASIAPHGTKTVDAVAKLLANRDPAVGTAARDGMSVGELRPVLEQLGAVCSAAGAKPAAKDLTTLATALRAYEGLQVGELAARLHASTKAARSPRIRKPATEAEPASDIVPRHIEALVAAGTDQPAFTRAFDALKADPAVKLAHADAIARGYAGGSASYKTKKAALDRIEKLFIERARFENKLEAVR